APTPDNWVASAGDLLAAGRRGTSTRRCARFHRRPATPIRDPWGTLLAARPARSRVRLLRLHHAPPTPIGGRNPPSQTGWVGLHYGQVAEPDFAKSAVTNPTTPSHPLCG